MEASPSRTDEKDGGKPDPPNWTEVGTFRLGIAQAVIGVLGLAGLFFTVRYARAAWKEAEKSANAVLLAERAFMHMERVVFELRDDGPATKAFVSWRMRNIGRTPGFVVKVPLATTLRADAPDTLPPYPDESITTRTLVAPSADYGRVDIPRDLIWTPEMIEAFKSGAARYYISGEIHYVDIFGRSYVNGFAFYILVSEDGTYRDVEYNKAQFWFHREVKSEK